MDISRYAAFSRTPHGGNPAGVVLDAGEVGDAAMLAVAAEVGYSETAFVTARDGDSLDIRYFSPLVEVPFCGHATIATAVAYARLHGVGALNLRTKAGPVSVSTHHDHCGEIVATLTSVPTRVVPIGDDDVAALLGALRWPLSDLDPIFPVAAAFAGAWHPIVVVRSRERLSELDYDMAALRDLMRAKNWTTVDLLWRASSTVFQSRNPFPPGGVWEDPATGAAAAAFGGYLREHRLVSTPTTITVLQGEDMGRPSVITVAIPSESGSGIAVSGTAVPLIGH